MNVILAGYKYVANFLDEPVRIGMIYQMDDDQFIPAMHFNDAFPNIDLSKWTNSGAPAALRFADQKQVSFVIGGSASSGVGKSEIKIGFQKSRSVAGELKDAVVDSLSTGLIKENLKKIWIDQGYEKFRKKYIFVFSVVTAASGTLIYSAESKNEVILKHKFDKPISKFADLGSGEFEYVSNKKRTFESIRQTAHKPLFKALYFRDNWQPEILG